MHEPICLSLLPPVKMARKRCPKTEAGILSKIFFSWFDSLAVKGFRRGLKLEDLWDLKEENKAEDIVERFESAWKCVQDKGAVRPGNSEVGEVSVLRVLFKAFGRYYAFGSLLTILPHLLDLSAPEILSSIIRFVDSEEDDWIGYCNALALFLTTGMALLLKAHVSFIFFVTALRVKTALLSALYKKTLVASRTAKTVTSAGEIMSLVSIDVQKVLDVIPYMYQVWVFPVQITIALILLWHRMRLASLAGVGVILALIPLNGLIGNSAKRYQKSQMRNKDQRIRLLNAIITGIKVLKFHAWEKPFGERVESTRKTELKSLRKAACLSAVHEFLSFGSQFLVALATFGTYVVLYEDEVLDAEKVFTSIALLNLIAYPIKALPITTLLAIKAAVSVKRLNKFLNSAELQSRSPARVAFELDCAISLTNCSFQWKQEEKIVLTDISVSIAKGELVAIVGVVGAGKSSLLAAMLGEMDMIKGTAHRTGTTSYVAQQAWIQNATVRDNIIFGKPFEASWYKATLQACSLLPDLENLPDGDNTLIGDKGINLSGGQKQRISIARAVYSNADLYLFDDPLSAVDAHVSAHIFRNIFGPEGLLQRKTRVLVTHGVSYLADVDRIVVLKNGVISEVGTFVELQASQGEFAKFLEANSTAAHNGVQERPKKYSPPLMTTAAGPGFHPHEFKDAAESRMLAKAAPAGLEENEHIPWALYAQYLSAAGWVFMIGSFVMYFVYQAFELGGKLWLRDWVDHAASNDTIIKSPTLYLGIYAGFGLLQSLTILTAAILLSLGCLRASAHLHRTMLWGMLRAPMTFFDVTASGVLTNRFVKDIDILDSTVAMTLRTWMTDLVMVIGTLAVIICTMPVFALVCIPGIVVFYGIQRVYVPTARQLMHFESTSRSPIYSHFNETLCGVTTIRAYGHQKRFISEGLRCIDENQTPYFMLLVAYRWLAVRLEGIASVIKLAVAVLIVIYRESLSEAAVGLALAYAMDVTYNLGRLIRSYCDIETNLVAFEHVQKFCELPEEASWESQLRPTTGWPYNGHVEFTNYSARYRDDFDMVLKGINCAIRSGEKIAVVGRTGAGKSSLVLSLFRIIEAADGVITIDGLDISKLGLHDLRAKLTIIPQDPTLFAGSLRFNLDPLGKHDDAEISRALELAHLTEFLRTLPSGLDYEIREDGTNLSVGQKQLVCLARALLQRSKILILDEATATVDLKTDSLIQRTIKDEFGECTVITIAHRLNTVLESDRIMVLSAGRIVELDTPEALLANTESHFYRLAVECQIVPRRI